MFKICSSRCRPPAFDGISPISPEQAKGIVDDFGGFFEDYEKILLLDDIFLEKKRSQREKEQEEESRKQREEVNAGRKI